MLFVGSVPLRLRYTGVVGDKNKITTLSDLLFKWHLELADEKVKSVDLQIRADHAFDRGVQVPDSWAELLKPSPDAPKGNRFSPTAAREVAKDAAQKARQELGDACRSVLCRPLSPPLTCV